MDILNLIWAEYADSSKPSKEHQFKRQQLQFQLECDFSELKSKLPRNEFKRLLRMEANYNLLLSLDDEKRFIDAFRLGASFMAQLLSASMQ